MPRFQGGYVWDWQDKSLLGRTEAGQTFFAYGGDFGETMHDDNCPYFMTNNGRGHAGPRLEARRL